MTPLRRDGARRRRAPAKPKLHARCSLILVAALPLACASRGDGGAPLGPASGGSLSASGGFDGGARAGAGGVAGGSAMSSTGGSAPDGTGGAGDDALIVPAGLTVMPLEGGNGVLDMIAVTVRNGPTGAEVYAALRNDGDMPACDAGLSVELFDKNGYSLGSMINSLLTQHLFRLADGSGMASCVGPGEVTMAAVTDFATDIALEELGYLQYRCPYFALDVAPADGFSVIDLASSPTSTGTSYRGTFVNGLDVPVTNPSVTVFPVNGVGRPLGAAVATGSGTDAVPSGGSWAFQTNVVDSRGASAVAFPSGAPVK